MNRNSTDAATRTMSVVEDGHEIEKGYAETSATYDFDPQVEKKLKLKADFILLPLLTVAYLLE